MNQRREINLTLDPIFSIAQVARKYGIKNWDENKKNDYWAQTATACESNNIGMEFIRLVSSSNFKEDVGNSHIFTHGLDIPFDEAGEHFGTMRAAAAHIVREQYGSSLGLILEKTYTNSEVM